jgi:hypothetical protein
MKSRRGRDGDVRRKCQGQKPFHALDSPSRSRSWRGSLGAAALGVCMGQDVRDGEPCDTGTGFWHRRGSRPPGPGSGCGPTMVCTMNACRTTGPLPGLRRAPCRVLDPRIRAAGEGRRAGAGSGVVGGGRVPSHRGVTRPVHRPTRWCSAMRLVWKCRGTQPCQSCGRGQARAAVQVGTRDMLR